MILIEISLHGKGKNGDRGRSPRKIFATTPFKSNENALFDIKRALQKRHCRSFAEKGRVPDPKDPPSCAAAGAE